MISDEEHRARDAKLDAVLAKLNDDVQEIRRKRRKASARQRGKPPSEKLARSPVQSDQLRKTRMCFQVLAEESLRDSADDVPAVSQEDLDLLATIDALKNPSGES